MTTAGISWLWRALSQPVARNLHSHLAPQPNAHPQEVVGGWSGYSLERQQEVLGAALAVASEGDWAQLEGQLRLALDLTAEG